MKTIQILGPGCPRCTRLAENARAAAEELGLEARVENVVDLEAIAEMGVLTTPGLAVDGRILATGRLLSVDQLKELFEELD